MTDWSELTRQQAFSWLKEGDPRAYGPLRGFLVGEARRLQFGADAEDLVHGVLESVLRLNERGALRLASAAELEPYLVQALRNTHRSLLRKRSRERLSAEAGERSSPELDGPEAHLRSSQRLARCLAVFRFALQRAEIPATTLAVIERLFDRHALGRDPLRSLEEAGLIAPDADGETQRLARNAENRRQSRARADLLQALDGLTRVSDWRSEAFDFDGDELAFAYRLALRLCRSTTPLESNAKVRHDEL